ncbi:MAG: hypothetical protein ACP5ME_14670 [Anaerolineae bacterium]
MRTYERDGKWFCRSAGGSWGWADIPSQEIEAVEPFKRLDGKWSARCGGASWGRVDILPEEIGPFDSRPEPVARWQKQYFAPIGRGQSWFTQFRVSRDGQDCSFILEEFLWEAAPGYSGAAELERFSDEQPPELGDCFVWTDDGWGRARHPSAAD